MLFFFAMKDVDACDKDRNLFLLKRFTLNQIGMYMTVTGCKMLVIRNGAYVYEVIRLPACNQQMNIVYIHLVQCIL
jgi:hypothetical protein